MPEINRCFLISINESEAGEEGVWSRKRNFFVREQWKACPNKQMINEGTASPDTELNTERSVLINMSDFPVSDTP